MLIALLLVGAVTAAPACSPASGDAAAVLRRAADVLGMNRADGRVLRLNITDIITHDYESDRPDPPYLLQTARVNEWIDPATGVIRAAAAESMVGGQQYTGFTYLDSRLATYLVRDTAVTPSPQVHATAVTNRPLDVWAVVSDWIASNDAHVAERCELRDYSRLVLTRPSATHKSGERLYIDSKSGYPVAVEWREPHYLWGQNVVQYQYATWMRVGNAHVPGTATRLVDGLAEITRTFGSAAMVARDSAPSLAVPVTTQAMDAPIAGFLAPTAVDTIRVSPTTFILRNPGYAETLTLARDTVFVFDATQGDARARQDSAWIPKLFPGKHAIAVVVTDLAFPHVAGVRYWVANGATIISHRASRPFLEKVVARRWADAPDLLEQKRGKNARAIPLKFRAVNDSLSLAGGAITVFAIDGPSSEGALAAFVGGDGFLWASDYIQSASRPTQYLDEVAAAVARLGITPTKVAAEHLPVVDWARLVKLTESR